MLSIIGGTGFVGSKIVQKASQSMLFPKISSISRKKQFHKFSNVDYLQGEFLKSPEIKEALLASDFIVYTPGILFQSFSNKLITYENVHYHLPQQIGEHLNLNNKNKPLFVYIGANTHFPISREYLNTKKKAEKFLSGLENLDFVSVRPNIILNKRDDQLVYKYCEFWRHLHKNENKGLSMIGQMAQMMHKVIPEPRFTDRDLLVQAILGLKFLK